MTDKPYTDTDVLTVGRAIMTAPSVLAHEVAAAVLDALAAAGRLAPVDDGPRHIIEFRTDGWTIKHPLTCRPKLFDCPVNRAAETELGTRRCPPAPPGRYECRVGDRDLGGMFLILGRVEDDGEPVAAAEEQRPQEPPCFDCGQREADHVDGRCSRYRPAERED